MVALLLKISIGNVVKMMQFEPSTMVYDVCRMICERVPEAQMGQRSKQEVIAAQEEMLCKERELEEARKKLAMIRQQQYKFLPSELRDEEQN